jgi:hypothetical protein
MGRLYRSSHFPSGALGLYLSTIFVSYITLALAVGRRLAGMAGLRLLHGELSGDAG